MKQDLKLELRTTPENGRKLVHFLNNYELVAILGNTEKEYYTGKLTDPQKCRFCNNVYPDVTFNNKPHVMPQFMGNHNLLSYFECDVCNSKISKYEDSFANFIGINRTTAKIKGMGNRIPKFKDPKTNMKLEVNKDSTLHFSFYEGTDVFSVDEDNKTAKIKYTQPSYIPIHIIKLLYKMGLSSLDESVLEQFDSIKSLILTTDEELDKLSGSDMYKVFAYAIPGPPIYDSPFVQVFRSKENNLDRVPTYQLLFYYAYYQFQLILPCSLDQELSGKSITVPIAPLFIDYSHIEAFGNEKFYIIDFSSNKKKKGTEQDLTLQFQSFKDSGPLL